MKWDFELLAKQCEAYLSEEPDEALRLEIKQLQATAQGHQELAERCAEHLSFGTAGLRGRMEAGYNRMNVPAVYRLAHALGSHIAKGSVVIAFDGRKNSSLFAQEVAQVLGRLNIKIFIFSEVVPTPICAFATKYLGAHMGVMITASHNPGYDNGIKLFDGSGAQANGQILSAIESAMAKAPLRPDFFAQTQTQEPRIELISERVFQAYFDAIKQTKLFDTRDLDKSQEIVYTALHGVGQKFFLRAANEEGFKNICFVEEQANPNECFPTLSFPNPEEEHTLDLAHSQAKARQSKWVFANDPDADRLQVSCLDTSKQFKKLSGNEMGSILGFFAIQRSLARGEKPLVASSIVSSRMLKIMARDLGASYVDALTGFGNIAHAALAAQQNSRGQFVFAYEEAIGFLVGQIVLDKDGINAGARFLEIAAWLKRQEISIWDFLDQLYMRFGLFMNSQWSVRFSGVDSASHMEAMMDRIRAFDTDELASKLKIGHCRKFDLSRPGSTGPYAGICATVLIFEKEDRYRLIVRPSGTEPKIKFYVELMDRVANPPALSNKKAELAENLREQRRMIEEILS